MHISAIGIFCECPEVPTFNLNFRWHIVPVLDCASARVIAFEFIFYKVISSASELILHSCDRAEP